MPRPVKSKTPLRLLREALGMSQKDMESALEAQLSLPPTTYKAYELGERKVTEKLATQLMLLTGVDPDSIIPFEGNPKTLDGKQYTSTQSSIFADRESRYTPDAAVEILTRLTDRYLVAMIAAWRAGLLTHAAYFFERAIQNLIQELPGVSNEIQSVLPPGKKFQEWRGFKMGIMGAPHKIPFEAFLPHGDEYYRALLKLLLDKTRKGVSSIKKVKRKT